MKVEKTFLVLFLYPWSLKDFATGQTEAPSSAVCGLANFSSSQVTFRKNVAFLEEEP